MKVIVDTNVLVSGIFFKGPPHTILDLFKAGIIKFVASKDILNEYIRVCEEISLKIRSDNLNQILNFIIINILLIKPQKLATQICEDKDDDKFIECALSSGVKIIITGDKHLLRLDGIYDIKILKPAAFLAKYSDKFKH